MSFKGHLKPSDSFYYINVKYSVVRTCLGLVLSKLMV